jgi:hypothetical protein
MSSSRLLFDTVSQICKIKPVRGKLLQDAAGKVYIFDCHHWSPECSDLLHYLCPNALLSVESATSSLSGFVVVVHHEPCTRTFMTNRRIWLAIFLLLVFYGVHAFLCSLSLAADSLFHTLLHAFL